MRHGRNGKFKQVKTMVAYANEHKQLSTVTMKNGATSNGSTLGRQDMIRSFCYSTTCQDATAKVNILR